MNGKVIISRYVIFNEDAKWCCHDEPVIQQNIVVDVSEYQKDQFLNHQHLMAL